MRNALFDARLETCWFHFFEFLLLHFFFGLGVTENIENLAKSPLPRAPRWPLGMNYNKRFCAIFDIFDDAELEKKIESKKSKKAYLQVSKHASNNAFRTSIPTPHPPYFFIIQHPAAFFSKIRDFPIVFDRIYYRKS